MPGLLLLFYLTDVLGVAVYQPDRGEFVFKPGPLFTNIVLADEINRTTPKTQSSLLEAMNEAQVSLDHTTHPLPKPFMVLATQNPHEYEGTFPLPEAQLDRFLLRIRIGYPDAPDEKVILRGGGGAALSFLEPVLDTATVLELQDETDAVRAEDSVLDYLMALVAATRVSPLLSLGVSPRGSLALLRRGAQRGRDPRAHPGPVRPALSGAPCAFPTGSAASGTRAGRSGPRATAGGRCSQRWGWGWPRSIPATISSISSRPCSSPWSSSPGSSPRR